MGSKFIPKYLQSCTSPAQFVEWTSAYGLVLGGHHHREHWFWVAGVSVKSSNEAKAVLYISLSAFAKKSQCLYIFIL